jgi:hypothetical protein
MKRIFTPEIMLFVSGLAIGMWVSIALLGLAIDKADLIVAPLFLCIFAAFTALRSWKECMNNRRVAERQVEAVPTEELQEEEVLPEVDIMKKPCPPHRWQYENRQMICLKCHKPPLFEERKM